MGKTCRWRIRFSDKHYETGCKKEIYFIVNDFQGLEANEDFIFCPYCGGNIVEVKE